MNKFNTFLQLMQLHEIIAKGGVVYSFDKNRPAKPIGIFNPDQSPQPTHVAMGGAYRKMPKPGYFLETAYATSLVLMIDLDTKEQESLDTLLSELQSFPPTAISETTGGYHLLWFVKPLLVFRDEYGDPTGLYDLFYRYSTQLLPRVKEKLNKVVKVDKVQSVGYTRLPAEDRRFELVGEVYEDFGILVKKIEDYVGVELEAIEAIEGRAPQGLEYVLKTASALDIINHCPALKHCVDTADTHGYDEWKLLIRVFANAYIFASDEEKDKIKGQFHALVSKHSDYKYEQNERFFEYYINKGFKPLRCSYITTQIGDSFCSSCPNRHKWEEQPFYSPYRNIVASQRRIREEERDEEIVVEDGFIYALRKGRKKRLMPDFNVVAVYVYNKTKYVVVEGTNYIIKTKQTIHLDTTEKPYKLIKSLLNNLGEGSPNITKDDVLLLYVYFNQKVYEFLQEQAEKSNGTYVVFEEAPIDPIEEGFRPLHPAILRVMGDYKRIPNFVYHREGNSKEYWKRFRRLLLNDIYLKYIVGASLLMFLHPYDKPYSLKHKLQKMFQSFHTENPVVILRGAPGAGKTRRLEAVLSLWGATYNKVGERCYNASNVETMTQAYISYVLPYFHIPIAIDDITLNHKNKILQGRLGEIIKMYANSAVYSSRYVAHEKYRSYPLKSVIFMSIEPSYFKALFNEFKNETGALRRALFMDIRKERTTHEFLSDLRNFVYFTYNNYGHINEVADYFNKTFELIEYEKYVRELVDKGVEKGMATRLAQVVVFTYNFLKFLNIEAKPEELFREAVEIFLEPFGFLQEKEDPVLKTLSANIEAVFEKLNEHTEITEKGSKAILEGTQADHDLTILICGVLRAKGVRNFKARHFSPHSETYQNLKAIVLEGEKKESRINRYMRGVYENCRDYIKAQYTKRFEKAFNCTTAEIPAVVFSTLLKWMEREGLSDEELWSMKIRGLAYTKLAAGDTIKDIAEQAKAIRRYLRETLDIETTMDDKMISLFFDDPLNLQLHSEQKPIKEWIEDIIKLDSKKLVKAVEKLNLNALEELIIGDELLEEQDTDDTLTLSPDAKEKGKEEGKDTEELNQGKGEQLKEEEKGQKRDEGIKKTEQQEAEGEKENPEEGGTEQSNPAGGRKREKKEGDETDLLGFFGVNGGATGAPKKGKKQELKLKKSEKSAEDEFFEDLLENF